MPKLIKIFLTGIILTATIHAKEIKNISEAINISGKQRMYTQRMMRDYAMIGMENNYKNPKKDLQNIVNDFEDSLDSLIEFNTEKNTEKALLDVKEDWEPIKKVLFEKATKENAKSLQEDLETLLSKSNKAVILFTKQSKKKAGEIINISGRQRMLSQRMASLYLLKSWGISDSKFRIRMDESMKIYKDSLKRLKECKINTTVINMLLKDAERNFTFFEVMNKSEGVFIPTLIFKKSDKMLKDMDEVTKLYTKIIK